MDAIQILNQMNFCSIAQSLLVLLVVLNLGLAQKALYKSVEEIDVGQELTMAKINEYIMKNWDALGGYEQTKDKPFNEEEVEALKYLEANGHKEVPNYKRMMELMQKKYYEKNPDAKPKNQNKNNISPIKEEISIENLSKGPFKTSTQNFQEQHNKMTDAPLGNTSGTAISTIAGIIGGMLVLSILAVALFFQIRKRKDHEEPAKPREKQKQPEDNMEQSQQSRDPQLRQSACGIAGSVTQII